MPREFKLPDLGEGIHEGEIVDVLVSVGDKVEDGQPVLVIETDKATTEVPSPATGTVKEIRVKAGDVVKVGSVLMTFSEEGEAEAPPAPEKPKAEVWEPVPEKETAPRPAIKEEPARAMEPQGFEKERERVEKPREASGRREGPVPASPSTRRVARELGVDLHLVTPTGPAGQVTAEDVREFAEKAREEVPEAAKKPEAEKAPERAAPRTEPPAAAPELPDFTQWGPVERVPLRSIRRATARRMALSWSQIPHVTHQDVADVTELEAFRQKHKEEVKAQGGALSLTVFVLKAAVAALKRYPRFNASLDPASEEIIVKHHYHIGVAVDTEKGLLVPVIRDVDRKSIADLARELPELAGRTREGKADLEAMSGGTFTVTNIGILGGTGFAPIINYPQAAILGMAAARLQPVVRGDTKRYDIVPRLMMPLLVGFDHRINDGADAARFLNAVIEILQDPEKMLMMV